MANTTLSTGNVGQAPVGILARALTGNIFIEQNLAYMNEGDKDGYNVYKYDLQNVLVGAVKDPDFSAAAGSQENSYKRSLKVVQTMHSFDPFQYHEYWKKYQPTGQFQWETLPSEVQSTLEELFLGSSAEAVEDALTNDEGTILDVSQAAGVNGGLIYQLTDGTQITDVLLGVSPTSAQIVNNSAICFITDTTVTDTDDDQYYEALTTDNIFTKIEIILRNQTKDMRKRPNRKFMISNGTADIMGEAQRLKLSFKGIDVTEAGIMRYAGYEFIQNPQFPDNTLLFASMSGDMKTDAIQLGTSQSADFTNVAVDRLSNFSREWGMLATFALDIFVVRPEEICLYTPEAIH
jgi:hypothetical protein